MLKPEDGLIQELEKRMKAMAVDKKAQKAVILYCHDRNINEGIILDYLLGQKEVRGATPNMLYILADSTDQVSSKRITASYFTASEIAMYSKWSGSDKIELPLRFKMLPVSEDAWIGPVTVQQLFALWRNQLINYNENTQRALKMSFYKGEEVYRIFVNRKAIAEIREAFHEGRYVPNTITLNIPDDSDVEFFYNTSSCEMTITKIKMFDILDGYHRLLAMMEELLENPEFDYNMELRITNYSEEKARQFIFQEDKKTRMKKVDSESYNAYAYETRVCSKVNMDPKSDVVGMIGNNSEINQGWLCKIIKFFWFKGVTKEVAKQLALKIPDALIQVFNTLIAYDGSYATKRYSYKEVLVVCYFANRITEGKTVNGEQISILINKIADDPDIRFKEYKNLSRTLVGYLDKLVEG